MHLAVAVEKAKDWQSIVVMKGRQRIWFGAQQEREITNL